MTNNSIEEEKMISWSNYNLNKKCLLSERSWKNQIQTLKTKCPSNPTKPGCSLSQDTPYYAGHVA